MQAWVADALAQVVPRIEEVISKCRKEDDSQMKSAAAGIKSILLASKLATKQKLLLGSRPLNCHGILKATTRRSKLSESRRRLRCSGPKYHWPRKRQRQRCETKKAACLS